MKTKESSPLCFLFLNPALSSWSSLSLPLEPRFNYGFHPLSLSFPSPFIFGNFSFLPQAHSLTCNPLSLFLKIPTSQRPAESHSKETISSSTSRSTIRTQFSLFLTNPRRENNQLFIITLVEALHCHAKRQLPGGKQVVREKSIQ